MQEFLPLQGSRCLSTPDGGIFIDGPEVEGRAIVKGQVWRWEFSRFTGPIFINNDGSPRKCQNPNKDVWKAFNTWLVKYEKQSKLKDCSVKKLRAIHEQMEETK